MPVESVLPARLEYAKLAQQCPGFRPRTRTADMRGYTSDIHDTLAAILSEKEMFHAYADHLETPKPMGLFGSPLVDARSPTGNLRATLEPDVLTNNSDRLQILYAQDGTDAVALAFTAERTGDTFDIPHRFVRWDLRGRGIGKQCLAMLDEVAAAYAYVKHMPAHLTTDMGQLDALCSFYNSGYLPYDPAAFMDLLKKIQEGRIRIDDRQYLYEMTNRSLNPPFSVRTHLHKIIGPEWGMPSHDEAPAMEKQQVHSTSASSEMVHA